MYCSQCGTKIEEGSSFCGKCGSKIENTIIIENTEEQQKQSNKKLDYILLVISIIAFVLSLIPLNNGIIITGIVISLLTIGALVYARIVYKKSNYNLIGILLSAGSLMACIGWLYYSMVMI